MSWHNAQFAALMTRGENHIRKEVSFARVTRTDLNLGDFDWTVEFWFLAREAAGSGVVLELGTGPRAENEIVTRLSLDAAAGCFWLENQAASVRANIPTHGASLGDSLHWHHYAFVPIVRATPPPLRGWTPPGRGPSPAPEAFAGPGRKTTSPSDATDAGDDPCPGRSTSCASRAEPSTRPDSAAPPGSFAPASTLHPPRPAQPLLFSSDTPRTGVVPLQGRKHLFLDDALFERSEHISFSAHPPRRIERVMDGIEGPFRKHLTVVEDQDGLIRLYRTGAPTTT